MRKLILFIILLCVLVPAASAQNNPPFAPPEAPTIPADTPAFAATIPGGILVHTANSTRVLNTSSQMVTQIGWNANGDFLTYRAIGGPQGAVTYFVGVESDTLNPAVLVSQNSLSLPLAFPAADQVVYGVDAPSDQITQDANGQSIQPITLVQRGFLTREAPLDLVTLSNFRTGCGGGSPYPMDQVYSTDTGLNGSALFLVLTDTTALHSLGCDGRGLGFTSLASGATIPLGADYARAALSPDGTRVAALFLDQNFQIVPMLTVIDLGSLTGTPFELAVIPDQIAWSADGESIYYTTRTMSDQDLTLTPEQRAMLSGGAPSDASGIPQYVSSIQRIDVATGAVTTILDSVSGWGISRLLPAANALYFTVVPDGSAWAEGVANGSIDRNRPDSAAQELALVYPSLYQVALDGGDSSLVVEDVGQVVLRPGA